MKEGRLRKGGGIRLMRCFSTSHNDKLFSKKIKETRTVWLKCVHTQASSNPAALGNESNKTTAMQINRTS